MKLLDASIRKKKNSRRSAGFFRLRNWGIEPIRKLKWAGPLKPGGLGGWELTGTKTNRPGGYLRFGLSTRAWARPWPNSGDNVIFLTNA